MKKSSHLLQTFEANRVSKIQIITTKFQTKWRHIPTEHNPADLVSRGIPPSELINNSLWWHGPEVLTDLGIN